MAMFLRQFSYGDGVVVDQQKCGLSEWWTYVGIEVKKASYMTYSMKIADKREK